MQNNYAVYDAEKTRGQAVQPCIHKIAMVFEDARHLEQAIETKCTLCGVRHNFRLRQTFVTTSPGQQRNFDAWCKTNQVEVLD